MFKNKVYIETYGCQMNVSDSEIVASILQSDGYDMTLQPDDAGVILLNTCSVRENAERKIFERLMHLKHYKKKNSKLVVGVIGCMAERLQEKLLNESDLVKIVVGPDEYRKIPALLSDVNIGKTGIAVQLGTVETYDDITPLRKEGVSAWLSIMRGCNNMCSFCVVTYTRGRERSKPLTSIIEEVKKLDAEGFKEITLLGQNVNSYRDKESKNDFADLLAKAAEATPNIRYRFTSSHPKDISDKIIATIASHDNICNHIHLAMQSGSNDVLKRMNRRYTIEHYFGRIEKIRELIPNCSITTDIIAGFPGETIKDHEDTLIALRKIQYDGAYMFKYSQREKTKADSFEDDVPEEEKQRRLSEIIELQLQISSKLNEREIGKAHSVLVEGRSKKSDSELSGRTDTNKVVIFPRNNGYQPGDLTKIKITDFSSATLFGVEIEE